MALCNLDELPQLAQRPCCLLGLDVGQKTIGVAVCDPAWRVASPLITIARDKFAANAAALGKTIKEREIGGLIVGYPMNMDGSLGPMAQSVRAFCANLLRTLEIDLPIVLMDERLSTAAVERFMLADDMTRKRRDEVVDKAAAAYILQGALDQLNK